MNIYKVVFVRNEIISCHMATAGVRMEGHCYYEHDNGHMIFAMVRANDEQQAREIAKKLVQQVSSKVLVKNS